ncbi:MAG: M20 family metallo-hydrolase [Candidatus Bathyarchaeota archaeon]|nr:M20 family metallo-hydrolase [Candidatus Bathyarchaeota archaeon]
MSHEALFREIEKLRTEMTKALMELIRVPAIAPENGGDGEMQKAEKLMKILETVGFDRIERHDAEDQRVSARKRPNIVAYYHGKTDAERLWIVTHLDVVPPGDENHWATTKPFEPLLKDGCVYGRGSEDNGQSLTASVFAVYALKRLGIKPHRTVCLAFVADEEQGSVMGIKHLMNKGIFRKNDLIVVPDSGTSDGSFIETAEKSVLWFKIRTVGKQVHASLPNKGLNAHRIGMQLAVALDKRLHEKYALKDDTFDMPESTFEPTKKERNVEAVNIIPGEDITYFDCRILPNYNVDDVLADINGVAEEFQSKTGAKIALEILQKQPAPKLKADNAQITALLKKALKEARGLEARVGGVGGGTCAAFFRQVGIPAVVWSTVDEVMHQPNEYSKVENMVDDAKVFALLAINP